MSHVTNTLCIYRAPLSTIGDVDETTSAAAIASVFTHLILSLELGSDVADLQTILAMARDINPDLCVFGYTALGGSVDLAAWQAQVAAWAADFGPTSRFPLTGIFVDGFGTDEMLSTRPNQNAAITDLHQMGYSAFVNGAILPGVFGPDPTSDLQPLVGTNRQITDYFLLEDVFQNHTNTQRKEPLTHLRGRLGYAAWVQKTYNARAAALIGAGAGMSLVPWQMWRSTIALLTSYGIGIYGLGDADYGATTHRYWLTNKANEGPPPWPLWCRHGGTPPGWTHWIPDQV